MQELKVEINSQEKKNYSIVIGSGVLQDKTNFDFISPQKALLVTNSTIFELYQEKIHEIFSELNFAIEYCILPDGEVFKNQKSLDEILTCAFENKLERNDIFIALGGGVIGDITGFAAAIYLRGIKFIQIPTTILAQVDSSVGGKVAVNSAYGKNLVGAFYQPARVISDLKFLKTLPEREILTGLSEVVKYSFIEKNTGVDFSDFSQFLFQKAKSILKIDFDIMETTIKKCCEYKAAVVSQDEKENGLRAILNFGHTIGHAIEKVTQYKVYTHGEAVAIGMKGAFLISKKLNKIDAEYFDFAIRLLKAFGLDYKIQKDIDVEKIIEALCYDKKVKNGKVRFVLPVGYAQVEILDNVPADVISEVIEELC